MSPQLIQKMAQIDSQVEFELATGSKVSGLLKEISSEHVSLDAADGPITIVVDSIISVQSLADVNAFESTPNTPNPDNQIDTSTPSNSKPSKIEGPDSANSWPDEVEASGSLDTDTALIDSIPEQDATPDVVETDAELVNSTLEQDGTSNAADTNTQLKDSDPEQITASESVDANIESTNPVNLEEQTSEQLDEIEDRFKKEVKNAKIELEPPDFTFPADELKGWQNSDIAGKWLQIKNKYENAQRINELSTKFGRIQPLLIELTPLVRRFTNSPSLKRAFAYFNALSHPDDWQKTIQIYQEIAIASDDSTDWFNVAVLALNLNEEELACYSLEKFFYGISVIDAPNAWYIYINLVEKFNNLPAFRELCKKDENDVAEDEIETLLDAAIYLFKRKVAAELAIEIVQRRIKGESAESLLKEVCQKLGGQSVASYRQFLSEFMNDRIAAEEKIRPTTPEPIHPLKRSTPDAKQYEIRTKWMQNNLLNALYRSAEQEDQNGNLEEAERLYQDCIDQDIKRDSAIKNLAMVLVRLGRSAEAVGLLEDNRQKVKDKRALDNVLIAVYPAAAQYEKAIDLLNEALKQAQDHERRSRIRMQIANTYIKLEDYVNAESELRIEVLSLRPQQYHCTTESCAFVSQSRNRYNEAEQILDKIQSTSPDSENYESC